MSSKFDVTVERMLERVTEEWQPLDPIVESLVHTVAPGVALRRYQARSTRARERAGRPTPTPGRELTDRQKLESGARSIINDRIGAQKKSGRLQVATIDGVRCVRLAPSIDVDGVACCPTCRRPFQQATTKVPPRPSSQPSPRPSPRPKVVYPKFPQWAAQQVPTAVGDESE